MTVSERVEPKDMPLWWRVLTAIGTEFVGIHPRLHAFNLAVSLLPRRTGGRVRADLLRALGFSVGRGTELKGPVKLSGPRGMLALLEIGEDCSIDAECMLEVSEKLRIGNRVTLEPGVMILTSTHELDFPQHRAGKIIASPVSIGDGAWLRARAIVLPGVEVGAGAVVEAGAVVNKNVEPHTRVGGMPAVKLESLRRPDEA
jgi:maltose O-acetyltransferase